MRVGEGKKRKRGMKKVERRWRKATGSRGGRRGGREPDEEGQGPKGFATAFSTRQGKIFITLLGMKTGLLGFGCWELEVLDESLGEGGHRPRVEIWDRGRGWMGGKGEVRTTKDGPRGEARGDRFVRSGNPPLGAAGRREEVRSMGCDGRFLGGSNDGQQGPRRAAPKWGEGGARSLSAG